MKRNRLRMIIAVMALAAVMAIPQFASAHDEGYLPYKPKNMFETETVTVAGPEAYAGSGTSAIELPDTEFIFFNTTTQEEEFRVKSDDEGFLPRLTLKKDHNYMITTSDTGYYLAPVYVWVSDYNNGRNGKYQLLNIKNCNGKHLDISDQVCEFKTVDGLWLSKRTTAMSERYYCNIPVVENGKTALYLGSVNFTLTSEYETLQVTSKNGYIRADLIEDIQYMVTCDDEKYDVEPFPLTVKDHSERGEGRNTYNHSSCAGVGIFCTIDYENPPGNPKYFLKLLKKGESHTTDTVITSKSGKTTAGGMNFRDLYLDEEEVNIEIPELAGEAYSVVNVIAVNPHRYEISKLCAGDFKITEKLPAGKTAKAVYELSDDGSLTELSSKCSGDVVEFVSHQISVKPFVIVYADKPAEKPAAKPTPASTTIRKLASGKKQFTVYINKKTSQVKGYQIKYSKTSSFKKPVYKTVKGSSATKVTVKKLKAKTRYYVKVRTYSTYTSNGKTYKVYSKWSTAKSIKTK